MSQQESRFASVFKLERRFLLLIIILGMTLVAACSRKPPQQISPAGDETEAKPERLRYSDIASAYHGLLLDRKMQEIKIDPAVLERFQDSMIESLTTVPEVTKFTPSDSQQQVLKAPLDRGYVEKVLTGFKFDDFERMLTKSALIQMGIDSAPSSERLEYQWRFDLIHERVVYINPPVTTQTEFERYLTTINLRDVLRHLLQDPTAEEYKQRCEANEVPIPPDWPTGDWRNRGMLPYRYNFLCSGPDTEVWTYEAPGERGVCYALPRKTGSAVSFLGIICQSKSTGKACFWDNIRSSTRCNQTSTPPDCRISGSDITLRIANLQGGSVLGENCTQCHRGGNAFMIHPRTPLADIAESDRYPDVRYVPLGQSSWVNPPAYSEGGTGSCASCHEIAEPTPDYCQILRRAAEVTMPDARLTDPIVPAGWISPRAGYEMHIEFLKRRCGIPELRCPLTP